MSTTTFHDLFVHHVHTPQNNVPFNKVPCNIRYAQEVVAKLKHLALTHCLAHHQSCSYWLGSDSLEGFNFVWTHSSLLLTNAWFSAFAGRLEQHFDAQVSWFNNTSSSPFLRSVPPCQSLLALRLEDPRWFLGVQFYEYPKSTLVGARLLSVREVMD